MKALSGPNEYFLIDYMMHSFPMCIHFISKRYHLSASHRCRFTVPVNCIYFLLLLLLKDDGNNGCLVKHLEAAGSADI